MNIFKFSDETNSVVMVTSNKREKSKFEIYSSDPSRYCVTVLNKSNLPMNCIRINNECNHYSEWFDRFQYGKKYVFIHEGIEYVLKAHSTIKGRFDGCAELFKKLNVKFKDKIILINNYDGTFSIDAIVY